MISTNLLASQSVSASVRSPVCPAVSTRPVRPESVWVEQGGREGGRGGVEDQDPVVVVLCCNIDFQNVLIISSQSAVWTPSLRPQQIIIITITNAVCHKIYENNDDKTFIQHFLEIIVFFILE